MNQPTATDPIRDMLHVHRAEAGFACHEETPLAAVLDGACLERAQPDFLACLGHMLENATPLLPDVEEGLDQLREHFLTDLRACLDAANLAPEQRVVVGLDENGHLRLVEPSESPVLENLFAKRPEMEAALREIAAQATLLRGIQDIGAAISLSRHGSSSSGPLLPGRYHVCLKGGLSHFYVPRS